MKIGLDAKRAFLNYTGLGNYSRNIILSLLENYEGNEYYLFTPDPGSHPFLNEVVKFKNVHIVSPKNKSFSSRWRSYGITHLINDLNLDVYHGLSNELPFNIRKSRAKKIVTIHDLIPFKDDTFRNIFDDYFSRKKMRKACRNADIITAISEETKKDIIQRFGTNENKIKVVYQPVGFNVPESTADVRRKYNLPAKFILQVGTVEYRKNIQIILRALIKLKLPDLHFVIVGKKGKFYKALQSYTNNNGLGNMVHFIDPVTNEDLAGIYKESTAVMYPSLYEGFGLPIIEAISYGKPVLTTKGGCFEEAGGPGAYYCDTESVDEVSNALIKILETNSSIQNEAGKQYISQFTSKATADGLMSLYN
jgi:glycosyltransferase involved in cell wall biosynthesis